MEIKAIREKIIRKRLSDLWDVPLFRIDVEVHSNGLGMRVALDGRPPTPEQMQAFENDIKSTTEAAKRMMN